MTEVPETQYANTADGDHTTYQVAGDGPVDLLNLPGAGGNIELGWEFAPYARILRRMSLLSRLILFDLILFDPLGQILCEHAAEVRGRLWRCGE